MEEMEQVEEVQTNAADVSGEVESAGTPEGESTESETTNTEPDNGTEEAQSEASEGKSAPDSPPFSERIQSLIARDKEKEAKIADLESKLNQIVTTTQQAQPDFVDLDFDKVNTTLQSMFDRMEELRLEGNVLAALEMQDQIGNLRQQIRDNEAKKSNFIQRMQAEQQNNQFTAQVNQRIAEASTLVAREHNIPAEVWKAGEEFFIKERNSKPLVDAQYREMVMVQGPIAALLWAKDYVDKNMGKPQQELIAAKEKAKQTLPPGKTTTVTPAPDLSKLLDKAKQTGSEEDYLAYVAAKRSTSSKRA